MNSAEMIARTACQLVSFLAVTALSLRAEVIRIHVLDGRNGKAITNEQVQVWVDEAKGALSLATGADGTATLRALPGSSIRIATDLYYDCRPFKKNAPRPTYSVNEILKSGLTAQNGCGKFKAEAKPGELLFFVRPVHWWEGMRW